MAIIDSLKIEIDGKDYTVVGGSFNEILAAVKDIEGRRWDADRKLWRLPTSLANTSAILGELGYQILGDEDDLLDAEVEEIEKIKSWILEDIPSIQAQIEELEANRGGYTGVWRSKAAKRQGAWVLRCAIKSAEKPTEELTEIEINGMKRACQIMGWS